MIIIFYRRLQVYFNEIGTQEEYTRYTRPNYSPLERHEDVPETLAERMRSVFHNKIFYSKLEYNRM